MGKANSHYKKVGKQAWKLMERLFPITRSQTGEGVRETFRIISEYIPLRIFEVSTGKKVLDWRIPQEWNIKDAYIKDVKGEKVVDFKKNNLHVVSYSQPVRKIMELKDLKKHLHTLPNKPDAIPYRTSYYEKNWGFCMSHKDYLKLKEGKYEVVINVSLKKGSLTYAECKVAGKTKDEFLVFTHICHPSLANDGLSAVVVATYIAKHLLNSKNLKYTYRFIFAPTTIGAITWLARNENKLSNVKGGLVLAELGGPGHPIYKKSKSGNALVDRIFGRMLKREWKKLEIREFSPWGHNERQFCSPGFNLPVGCLMRNPHEEYREYHTSLDNLSFVKPEHLADSYKAAVLGLDELERQEYYLNLHPKGEPQLGKRGIYKTMNTLSTKRADEQKAMLWVLNYSDKEHSLGDISEKSGVDIKTIRKMTKILEDKRLIKKI